MNLYHFNFKYRRDCRITPEQIAAVVAQCSEMGYRRVGVYGLGSAGQGFAERLREAPGLRLAGCFDVRHAILSRNPELQHLSILPPDAMAEPMALDCIVNTTPPASLVDVAETLARVRPQVPMLSLYDPFAYLDELQDDPYKLYWQLSRSRSVPDEVAALASAMTARLREALARWHDCRLPSTAQRVAACDKVVAAEQRCLGLYLQSRFEQCMALAPAARVPALLAFAEEFPFFVMARDAAACLLTQAGDFQGAVDAFRPAVTEYPCCQRTKEKLVELLLLADAPKEAFPVASAVQTTAPPVSGDSDDPGLLHRVLNRWTGRRVLPPLQSRERIGLRITSPVWGAAYLDLFLRVTVPSLLASGNIPHAARFHDVCYTLYTRRNDLEQVRRHPAWQEVARHVPVELVCVEDVDAASGPETSKYSAMSRYHSDALRRSREEGRFTFLTLGDFLFSSRFLARSLDLVLQGHDTVLYHSTRFAYEDVMARIVPRHVRGHSIEIDADTLMSGCLPYLHQSQRNYLDDRGLPLVPNTYYALDSHGSLVGHVFARTPLLLAPQAEHVSCEVGLDVDLPYAATDGGLGRYALVRDTSEMAFVELTSRNSETDTHVEGQPDPRGFARWLHQHTDPVSRYFGAHAFVFRNGNVSTVFHDGQRQLAETVHGLLA